MGGRRKRSKDVVIDTTLIMVGGEKMQFMALKVSRLCPLVLLVKVSWR
jgi:hypothetical protein